MSFDISTTRQFISKLPEDMIAIPRAQHEALMAAAKYVLGGYDHIVPCACRLCGLRGALRAAGIQEGE